MMQAGIVGGSGYTGGELLRLLHMHPQVELTQMTSRQLAGRFVYSVHPQMRAFTQLKFIHPDALQPCDLLFLALPHKESMRQIDRYAGLARYVIDLSADFRLESTAAYAEWYGEPHAAPHWLEAFSYGLPEANRERLQGQNYVSSVGCNATAVNLALLPLVRGNLLDYAAIEIKVGSSEAGNRSSSSSHHPVRSGAVRTYKATGHRHMAEVEQVLGADLPIHFALTAIEMVRGVHLLAHCRLRQRVEARDIWRLYRSHYRDEPFIRLVKSRTGLHRLPEPRLVAGTNYCDIGFELDARDAQHLVLVAALDNLGKGAAGNAVQCMNIICGFDERAGLDSPGWYP